MHWPTSECLYPYARHLRSETDLSLVARPRLLAWSMRWREHIMFDTHGVIPFRRV